MNDLPIRMYAFISSYKNFAFEKSTKTNLTMKPQEKFTQEAVIKSQSNITTKKRGIFTIAEKDGKYHILVQNYIVSEKTFDKLQLAERYINSKPWELIINVTSLTQKLIKQNEKSQS